MTHPRRTRRWRHPLSLALCGGLLVTGIFTAAPAVASVSTPVPPPGFGGPGGCTSVTSDGAMLCLWVDQDPTRPPLFVKTVRGTFSPPASSKVHACDYQLSYYRDGIQRTDNHLNFGCQQASGLPDSEDFPLQDQLDVDKPICVRIRTTQSRDNWTRATCVTIDHDNSTEVGQD